MARRLADRQRGQRLTTVADGTLSLLLVVAPRGGCSCLARYDGFALIEQRDFLATVPPQNRLLEAGYLSRNDVAHIRIASLYH